MCDMDIKYIITAAILQLIKMMITMTMMMWWRTEHTLMVPLQQDLDQDPSAMLLDLLYEQYAYNKKEIHNYEKGRIFIQQGQKHKI